ncbi:hypothetical protein PFNF54_02412 [Plasmodium falciparum NF54]|uniref:Uncharacterized protein n=1 Tax=Plasmodium falciparum (isolate NF54) TaxID=5843 RepID=W7KG47_PLAFO|nr:hypothetical protein PFNF54_02412 [Plasmodium falciparum NF54]
MSRRRDHKCIFYKNCFYFFQITPQIMYIYHYILLYCKKMARCSAVGTQKTVMQIAEQFQQEAKQKANGILVV